MAASLARASMDASGAQSAEDAEPRRKDVSLELVDLTIEARRLRDRCFPKELFADPAWGILLNLLRAEILEQSVLFSDLCVAAAVRPTNALRWVEALVKHGLVIQRPDPIHFGRAYVELSPEGSAAFRRYFFQLHAT